MKFTLLDREKIDHWKALKRYLTIALIIEFIILCIYTPYASSALNITENIVSHLHHWIRQKEDKFIEWTMNVYEGAELVNEKGNLCWINIDNDTYKNKAWHSNDNSRGKINKSNLLKLIKSVLELQPALVVVDVSLRTKETLDSDFQINYLAKYNKKEIPIVLTGNFYNFDIEKNFNEIKSIYWALPTFYQEEDGVIRRFKLWKSGCPDTGDRIIPSIPLLANALVKTDGCEAAKECDFHYPTSDCFALSSNMLHRIIYRFPWKNADNSPSQLKVISAENLKGNKEQYGEKIKGSIVIIGGSYQKSNDFHETPLGEMPGSLIIINAIHSLQIEGANKPFPLWAVLLILTAIVFLIAVVFSQFGSTKGSIISSAIIGSFSLIVLYIFPDTLFIFKNGVPFTFAIALSIVGILGCIPIGNVDPTNKEKQS